MARDINIRPGESGLDRAGDIEIGAARRGGALESLLGLASEIPSKVAAAKRRSAQQDALRRFVETGNVPGDLEIGTPKSAVDLFKARIAGQIAGQKAAPQTKNFKEQPLPDDERRGLAEILGLPETLVRTEGALQRAVKARSSLKGPKAGISGVAANAVLGVDFFKDDDAVTPQSLITARMTIARQKAPAEARKVLFGLKNAKSLLTNLQGDFERLRAKGQTGPIRGRVMGLAGSLTGGEIGGDVVAFNRLREGMVGTLKSLVGEVGRLTDYDIARMLKLTASLELSGRASQKLFKDISEEIENIRKNLVETFPTVERQLSPGSPKNPPKSKAPQGRAAGSPTGIPRGTTPKAGFESLPAALQIKEAFQNGTITRSQAKEMLRKLKGD